MLIIGTGLAGLRAAISAAMTNDKLDIGVISKVQVMRSHSVSAEGEQQLYYFLTRETTLNPIFMIP